MRRFELLCAVIVFCGALTRAAAAAPAHANDSAKRAPAGIAEHADIYVTALPGNSQVWVDGAYAGQAPLLVEITPGDHRVTVLHPGWLPASASLTATPGRVQALDIIMHAAGGANPSSGASAGTLSVRGALNGANVYVDGIKLGTIPIDQRKVSAGHHLVTVGDSRVNRIVRAADVYPGSATVVLLSLGTLAAGIRHDGDMLAPVYAYVPPRSVNVSGDDIIVHYNGMELQCRIGSREYMLNGRAASSALAPALINGKIFLPVSLLKRMQK